MGAASRGAPDWALRGTAEGRGEEAGGLTAGRRDMAVGLGEETTRSGGEAPARRERQQEEPLRAAPDTPPPSTTPPRGVSPARAPTAEPTCTEEEEASLDAGGSVPATNVGGEGTTFSQFGTDPPSTDQEDIDTVIEEVAKDAEAESAKIAAGEAAKSAVEEAAKGPAGDTSEVAAGESGKAAAEEAAKEPAGEGAVDDQPSSYAAPRTGKYLKVGDDLFIRLLGTADPRAPAEGEIFDNEALTTAGLQVVDEPSADSGGSQEEQVLRAMNVKFQKLQALLRARQDKVNSRMAAVDKAEADFQERVAQTQEEDLIAREEALAATLRGKDEEIGKIVAQRTQELEQKHKDALDALALDHADKVEKLELEQEELKKKVSELKEERDTTNRTLADLQVAISDKTKLLSEANDSINDLKLKLDGLEGTLSEVRAREETLNKALESEMSWF
nr:nuclear matrix constituent protein 1a-like [Aegilops tauschii subsp. strangulata]